MKRKLISKVNYVYYSTFTDFVETEPSLYTIYNIPLATHNMTHTKLTLKYNLIYMRLNLFKVMNVEERYEKFW